MEITEFYLGRFLASFLYYKMSKRKNNKKLLLIYLTLCVVLITALFSGYPTTIRSALLQFTHPVQTPLLRSGSDFFKSVNVFRNISEVREDMRKLHRQNNRFLAQIANLQSIRKENEELRKALDIFSDNDYSYQMATVTGRILSVHEIIITHNNSVFVGDPVITPDRVLIGFVTETSGRFSNVTLLTSNSSSIKAVIQNSDFPVGVLRGDNSRMLVMDTIAKDKNISVGNLVTASQHQEKVIDNVYVGRVIKVNDSAVDAFKSVVVYQDIDIRDISYLIIVSDEGQ